MKIKSQYTVIFGMLLSASTSLGQAPATPPVAYPTTSKISYVREYTTAAPISDASLVPNRPVEEVKTITAYVDGLGRPLQSVNKQASPLKKDLVNATAYDIYGREVYKYLPFVSSTTSLGGEQTSDGSFKTNPFQQQQVFMNAQFGGQGETFFYAQTDYEASPLNRPSKVFAPGNSWVGSRGTASEKAVQQLYEYNTLADAIPQFSIAAAQGSLPVSSIYYPAGTLRKNVTIDERGNQVAEFKDLEGRVLAKKVQVATTVTDGNSGWLTTYYVYDDMNQLRFVMPPKAVEAWLGGSMISNFADELCFRYEYDYRQRMIIKKMPGSGETWMVYDKLDRLVMLQDGNQRNLGKWMVTVYDGLNRPTQTGLLTDAITGFATHQQNANASSSYPSTATNFELLVQNYYDDYSWVSSTGTTLSATMDVSNAGNSGYFITSYNVAPNFALPLTPSYVVKGLPTGSITKVLGSSPAKFLYSVLFYDEKGQVIQTQTINNSGGKDINTTQYDFAGKPLRSLLQHNNVTAAGTQSFTVLTRLSYDHQNRLLVVYKTVSSLVAGQTIATGEKTVLQNSYDELGQLQTKKIGNKQNSPTELESLSYDYNIRGWLLGVNRGYVSGSNNTNYFGMELAYDKTGSTNVATSYTTAQYNGNIAGTLWKSKGDGINRQYDYTYDNANRLLQASFKQNNASDNSWNNAQMDFTVKMGDGVNYATAYDANGNIRQLQQWGLKVNANAQIDNLHYTYFDNSNKLQNVIDYNNDATTKLGDFRTSGLHPQSSSKAAITTDAAYISSAKSIYDYGYDVNGNMVTDRNKDLAGNTGLNQSAGGAITYNYLNLPSSISVSAKGSIAYTYDASGNKLQKITTENGANVTYNGVSYPTNILTTTDYIAGFVYETKGYSNGTLNGALGYTAKLQFFAQEEGRVRALYKNGNSLNSITGFAFDYMIKDHLGNTRMVLTDEQQQDIYPAATLESALSGVESAYYTIDASKIVASSAATGITNYPNNNIIANNNPSCTGTLCTTDNSTKLYQVNSSTNKTGLGITLKVMAGDVIDIFGKSYYFQNNAGGSAANSAVPVSDLLSGLLGNLNGAALVNAHGPVTSSMINTPLGVGGINTLLSNQTAQSNAAPIVPKAFINYLFFDDQFKCVGGSFSQVGSNSTVKDHHADLQNIAVPKNGFVYIYVSNESPVNVFFDNLQVVHTRGAILEETHYNPWGMKLLGISSQAAGKLDYKYKYNGKELQSNEFIDGSGLEDYDFEARYYDPQIGVFTTIDPLSENSRRFSPYVFCADNPVRYLDPDGMSYVGYGYDNMDQAVLDGDATRILGPNIAYTQNGKAVAPTAESGSASTDKSSKGAGSNNENNAKTNEGNANTENLETSQEKEVPFTVAGITSYLDKNFPQWRNFISKISLDAPPGYKKMGDVFIKEDGTDIQPAMTAPPVNGQITTYVSKFVVSSLNSESKNSKLLGASILGHEIGHAINFRYNSHYYDNKSASGVWFGLATEAAAFRWQADFLKARGVDYQYYAFALNNYKSLLDRIGQKAFKTFYNEITKRLPVR
jgi:RHS repeat-associated protein